MVPHEAFLAGVRAEILNRGIASGGQPLQSIYLGGGTPSLIGPDGIAALLDLLREYFDLRADAEVSMEVNPEDVSREVIVSWKDAGVNRLSVGVQTFDEVMLAWMHRQHGADGARRSLNLIRNEFENVSADLIFALPEGSSRDMAADIRELLSYDLAHISIYGLTAEAGTPYYRRIGRGELAEARDERYESEFLQIDASLSAAGFRHYEVSNYARPDRESRHNSAYWSAVPYLGVGPSAHGFDGSVRRWNVDAYASWLRHVTDGVDPVEGSERLTPDNIIAEQVYLGLRTTSGLQLEPHELATVAAWEDAGWGAVTAGKLVLSPLGWLRLDSLAAVLTAARSR